MLVQAVDWGSSAGAGTSMRNPSLPLNEPYLINTVCSCRVGVSRHNEGVGDIQLGRIQDFGQSVDLMHEGDLVCSTCEWPGTGKAQ